MIKISASSEVVTAVVMKGTVFWVERLVVPREPNVSEECIALIFKVEE
jgi:hypothetical protein